MKLNLTADALPTDRLATPDEILAAALPFPSPIAAHTSDIPLEIASDAGGFVRISARDFEVSLMVEELMREKDGPDFQ